MNFASIKSTLSDLTAILFQLSDTDFCKSIPALSGASIGEHTRHIIELFQTVIQGYDNGTLNYDARERDKSIQTQRLVAVLAIENIIEKVEKENKPMVMEHSISCEITHIDTNYFREILYNLEHCIHHQALIKVGLLTLDNITISENFGIAPSTLEYRKKCAQ